MGPSLLEAAVKTCSGQPNSDLRSWARFRRAERRKSFAGPLLAAPSQSPSQSLAGPLRSTFFAFELRAHFACLAAHASTLAVCRGRMLQAWTLDARSLSTSRGGPRRRAAGGLVQIPLMIGRNRAA